MKTFLIKCILFFSPFLIFLSIWISIYGIPPPNLSSDISFNAKMLHIKERHLGGDITVIAIGSSMTLNNIHTPTITKYLGKGYVSISSWGQNMEDDFYLLKIFGEYYKPKILLISSNYMDFTKYSKRIRFNQIGQYLRYGNIVAYEGVGLNYCFRESKKHYQMKHNKYAYSSLHYDDCGGVNLPTHNFVISDKRWAGAGISQFKLDPGQYSYLDSISRYCKAAGIKLVFAQSPYRYGYYSQLSEVESSMLNAHKSKIDSILTNYGQSFIDSQKNRWDDSLFADYSHLNENGAKKFTEFFIEKSFNRSIGKD